MAVRQQHLGSSHALAQRGTFMGHQRQQPLQRVGCLRQAMYQLGLVAAALRPASAFPAASPCAFACGSHLIDSSRGAFSERGKQDGFQGQGSADFGATPSCLAMPLPCWCCRQPNPAHQACVPTFAHQATVQLRATKTTARALQKTVNSRACAPHGLLPPRSTFAPPSAGHQRHQRATSTALQCRVCRVAGQTAKRRLRCVPACVPPLCAPAQCSRTRAQS